MFQLIIHHQNFIAYVYDKESLDTVNGPVHIMHYSVINSSLPGQNGRRFVDDIFKSIS